MKKNTFFLVLATLLAGSVSAQSWRIAPTFGLNVASISYSNAFRNSLNSGTLTTRTGPLVKGQVGALIDYAFSDRFSIRSGLLYTGKGGSLRMSGTQYGIVESIRGSYKLDYLDVPLLLNFAVGRNNWRIIVGAVAGLTLSAKGTVEGTTIAGYGYYRGNTTVLGVGNGANQVQPFDFCTTIGYVKELDVADHPLEVGLYFQNSLTNWNSSAKIQSDLTARHLLCGVRVAYLFELRR